MPDRAGWCGAAAERALTVLSSSGPHDGSVQIGGPELLVVLLVAGLVLGPSRIPRLARDLGAALHELRAASCGEGDEPEHPKSTR